MNYLYFSLVFMAIHTIAYVIAGVVAYKISGDLYQGEDRLLDFLADPEEEASFSMKKVVLAQLVRGLLMSAVLYPLLGALRDLSFGLRLLFFAGLMFVYTDLSSASPFPSNIEGFVYMKDKYLQKNVFWKTQAEMVIYSVVFGLSINWLLF